MANRNLNSRELQKAGEFLEAIRTKLDELAGGDKELLFAYRRKIAKELGYDERSKPGVRKRLKMKNGHCKG